MTTSPAEYLQSSFDPSKALVSQLRGILLAHDIPYSSSAKKAELVTLYNTRIRPQAATLLRELSQVKASSQGILDGESQNGSLAELDTGSESAAEADAASRHKEKGKDKAKVKKKKKRVSEKRSQSKGISDVSDAEDRDDLLTRHETSSTLAVAKRVAKPSATPSKRKASDLTRTSGDDARTPQDRRVSLKYESGGESGFSDYNPFQSGAEETPERHSTKRRKSSMGPRRSMLSPDASASASGRKSTPAMPSRREDESLLVAPMDLDDEDEAQPQSQPKSAESSPLPERFRSSPRAASQLGTPGVKYMVPLKQSTTSPASPTTTSRLDIARGSHSAHQAAFTANSAQSTSRQLSDTRPNAPQHSSSPVSRPGEQRKVLSATPSKRIARKSASAPAHRIQVPLVSRHATRRFFVVRNLSYALLAVSLCLLAWWREEKIAMGFCDTASSTNAAVERRGLSLALPAADRLMKMSPSLGPLLDAANLRPSCTPCPTHGRCVDGAFAGCAVDYIPRNNPLRLGGLVPLAPQCVADTEKLMVVAQQASQIAKALRVKRGQVVCGSTERRRNRTGKGEAWVHGICAEDLLAALHAQNKMSRAPYEDGFLEETNRLALRDLESHGEIVSHQEGEQYWYASKAADMPIGCRVRLAVLDHLRRHKLRLSALLLFLSAVVWIRGQLRRRVIERSQVRELVNTVLEELRKQERQHHLDPALAPSPALAQSHLRDLILQHEHSASRRQRLWKQVETVVEGNSNVRAKQVEISGEDLRAWEWTGQGLALERLGDGGGSTLYPTLQA